MKPEGQAVLSIQHGLGPARINHAVIHQLLGVQGFHSQDLYTPLALGVV